MLHNTTKSQNIFYLHRNILDKFSTQKKPTLSRPAFNYGLTQLSFFNLLMVWMFIDDSAAVACQRQKAIIDITDIRRYMENVANIGLVRAHFMKVAWQIHTTWLCLLDAFAQGGCIDCDKHGDFPVNE